MPEQAIVIDRRLDQEHKLIAQIREKTGADLVRIALVRRKMAGSLRCKPKDVAMEDVLTFMLLEQALGLDSLLGQIYWIERGGRASHQVGIDGFRAIADRSGTYAGSEKAVFRGALDLDGLSVPEEASVTVRKLVDGHVASFVGVAFWTEFYPGAGNAGQMYRKMPRHMLAKDAEAQALRKGWPSQLGGVPYSSQIEVTEAAAAPPAPDAEMYERIYGSQDEDLDAEHPSPAPGPEVPAEGPAPAPLDAWAENRRLSEIAEALGLKPKTLRSNTALVQVEAYNVDLQAQIDEVQGAKP